MRFIEWWVHNKKTPIPLKAIVAEMKRQGVKEPATVYALKQLTAKKYLRRAIIISNTRSYVQLRRV